MNLEKLKASIQREIHEAQAQYSILLTSRGESLAINGDKIRPAASLAKIPILIEVCRQIDSGKLHPEKLVYIEEEQVVGGSGIISYLSNSNIYSYLNLIELMIIVSDNTAANILLDSVGIDTVNHTVEKLGAKDTVIQRKFMDTEAQGLGQENYTTAKDMITLLKAITEGHNSYISSKSREFMKNILAKQQLTNKLAKYIQPSMPVSIFHKTGELCGVEHDVALLESNKEKVYIAVLSDQLPSNAEGQRTIAQIGKHVIDYVISNSKTTLANF
ncbi:serine hydrolase [Oceanobacillus manasiensis]|uniref:serine hydrolase n=1 Tax=Oceanobacillus manasiensis TaxID=586413 RepID=UPI000A568C87|nr:serine hydrolase [Oceanobacillus manasiensis]